MTTFADLKLIDPLLAALKAEKYENPTPIQAQSIPHLLEGRDLFGCAQTGTGKTAAFALPILQRLSENKMAPGPRRMRCLVLAPTRELAVQICDSFRAYGRYLGITHTVIVGGVSQSSQARAVARGVDVVVATPGRLLDLKNQGLLHLDRVEVLVLDEADRMLDMGFIHDIRKVLAAVPSRRQTLLFSATMPDEIASLAASTLRDPLRVEVTPVATTAERVDQKVLFVHHENKRALLGQVLSDPAINRALVFTRTKHGANRVAEQLGKIRVTADAIHGNKSQNARQRALDDFRTGRIRVLVATDIAARGIDIDGITHVINYDLPNEPESYVHRIGRTARAGASGVAISFCDASERPYLRGIEKVIRQPVPVVADHPYHCAEAARPANSNQPPARRAAGGRPGGRSRSPNSR